MKLKTCLCLCLLAGSMSSSYANQDLGKFIKGLSLSMGAAGDQPGGLPYYRVASLLAKTRKTIQESTLNDKTKECLIGEFKDLRLMSYGSTYFNNMNSLIHNATMGKKTVKDSAFIDVNEINIDFEINGTINDIKSMRSQLEKEYKESIEPVVVKCNL